jgi:hypothetical protein
VRTNPFARAVTNSKSAPHIGLIPPSSDVALM